MAGLPAVDDWIATVIGVMPPEFELLDDKAQLWLLLTADPRWATLGNFTIHALRNATEERKAPPHVKPRMYS